MQQASEILPPIDFEAELNDEQYAAVTAPPGPALVLAGAGSGKTRTLTYRVAWLLHQGVKPWNILLLTFTNKAAREMLDRVEDLTGVPRRQFWGGTFHSIGQRILRMSGESIGVKPNFTILDQSDAESLLGEVIRETDASFLKNKENPKAKSIYDLISYARNTDRNIAEVAEERYPYFDFLMEKIPQFAKAYALKKAKQQVADYDDLLSRWLELLEDKSICEHFSEKFHHVLVDEYQDTNIIQGKIIDRLSSHHRVMGVGDDAQCIYTWRGAEIENILSFPERHPGTKIYKIETNYRSTPEILDFANDCLRSQPSSRSYDKMLKPVRDSHIKPMLVQVMDPTNQAHTIIKRIEGLIHEGYNHGDIAVLYRAHYHSMELQMELSRQGFDFVITSGVRFFEQAHIRDLAAHLRFAVNPDDSTAFTRLLALMPRIGPRGAQNIYKKIQDEATQSGKSMARCLRLESVLKKIPAPAKDDYTDFALTLENIVDAMGQPETNNNEQPDLFDQVDNQTTECDATPEAIVQIAIEGWYGGFVREAYPQNWQSRCDDLESLINFAGRYNTMEDFLTELVLLNSETGNRSTEVSDDSIRLSTIHQAKGLEFPIVFVIGLAQGFFPLKRTIEEGDLNEERRLFYVASTRAMKELYLTYPRIALQNGSPVQMNPSQFLQEISPEYYEVLHSSH